MMKRVWVKKEHMYYKPFYKQKLKMGLLFLIVASVVFFSYQIFCMSQLNKSSIFFDSRQDSSGQSHNETPHKTKGHYNRFQSVHESLNKTANPSAAPLIGGSPKEADARLRGVHISKHSLYIPPTKSDDHLFRCLSSGVEISFDKVNDDYCDCEEDGSDEPATNACSKGQFFCIQSMKSIPSSRINDGICDCCDGSDEWQRSSELPHLKCLPHLCT